MEHWGRCIPRSIPNTKFSAGRYSNNFQPNLFQTFFKKKIMDGWPHLKYNSQKPKQKYVNKMVIWTWNRQEGKKIKTINQIHSSYYRFGGFAKYLTLGWLHLERWNFSFDFLVLLYGIYWMWADEISPFQIQWMSCRNFWFCSVYLAFKNYLSNIHEVIDL